MKCPKCGFEMESGVSTCPECGFSSTIDGVPVQTPIVEAPVVPDVVSAPVVDAPVVDAPVVDAPAVEAPVVDAPVVDAPVVDAPKVEAPAVETPVVDAPVVDAPKVEAPVVETPTVESPKVETPVVDTKDVNIETVANATGNTDNVVEAKVPHQKEYKSVAIYVVIGILAVIVIALVILLVKNGANSSELAPIEIGTNKNKEVTKEPTEETPSTNSNVITLNYINFTIPQDFAYLEENSYYSIYNEALRKIFILENVYAGNQEELEAGLELIKMEYPNSGCTDITTSVNEKNGIKYGLVEYTYNGSRLEELYAVLNDKFIVAYYNVKTNLVTTDEFVDYTINMTTTGAKSANVFAGPIEELPKFEYGKHPETSVEFDA